MTTAPTPPNALPAYRLLTGPGDATFNGQHVIVAQAIVWPGTENAP